MEIKGRLSVILPVQTGTGKNGTWTKKEFVLETEGQYSKLICFNVWGDKVKTDGLKIGQMIEIKADVESREYNGRYFTEVKAFYVKALDGSATAPNVQDAVPADEMPDDLPF